MLSETYQDPLRKRHSIGKLSKTTQDGSKREGLTATEEPEIEWSNLIFLPFHPVFKLFVLVTVFIKVMLGPIQAVYPIIYCNDVMDYHPVLICIKYSYWYLCDVIYGIDTFLHIVHRQVVDKAVRREHLPKSAFWLLVDIFSLLPLFRLAVKNPCPTAQVWPNILAFNEFLIIYRIIDYFELRCTHSYLKLLVGGSLVMGMCINCIACFFLLVTYQGFCDHCNDKGVYFDWRAYISHKLNETDEKYATFIYGVVFIYSYIVNMYIDDLMPSTILEYMVVCLLMVLSYVLGNLILVPKSFAESTFRIRKIYSLYSRVKKVIDETERRNPNDDSAKIVKEYYKLLYEKQRCIVKMPQFFFALPRYLRLEIMQDLLWPLFYHSPTLRKTSYPFRRLITNLTVLSFKLPGENFFTGLNNKSSLYYLKSGIIQLISLDDGMSPILSVTAGTIFGDISFFAPHTKRKVRVRCLTYCEFYYVERVVMIRALHLYPDDRKVIMNDARGRLSHAKVLFANKKNIRGIDRNEDEGICWITKRWWDLPHDETIYHCPKYIGQLVLCNKTELRTNSMFTKFKFPWIINDRSQFGRIWYRILSATVLLVLLLYPKNLVKAHVPPWFVFFTFCTDTIYIFDIGVSLMTAVKKHNSLTNTFSSVIFERCKSVTFFLDILSTIWIEDIAELWGASPELHYTLQFNRVIKVYILFYGQYLKLDVHHDPMIDIFQKMVLAHLTFHIVTSHFLFDMLYYFPKLSVIYFFGKRICSRVHTTNCTEPDISGVTISWLFEYNYAEHSPSNLIDVYVATLISFVIFILCLYCKGRYLSYLYLRNTNMIRYQSFVIQIKKYYEHYRIHQVLLKRLDRYLLCHWKYYKGADVLETNKLENDARAIYWKAQGNLSKSIISQSKPFLHADLHLIRDLSKATNYLILPKNSNMEMFGVQCKNVIWVAQGYAKTEYSDENGELVTEYFGPGSLLTLFEIFLGRVSLRSYMAYTDCEVIKDFLNIYKKYPEEYMYVQNCVKEFGSRYNDIFKEHVLKRRDLQQKLRNRIYITKTRRSSSNNKIVAEIQDSRSLPVEGYFWGDPESGFMQSWMLFRVIIVCISIISAAVLGGVGAVTRWRFMMISSFCDCIAFVDIIIKLCLPYYDKRGICITDKALCLRNYLTKGFLLDIIGALPWFSVFRALISHEIDDDTTFLMNTVSKFAHIYIIFAYFDYITDVPTLNCTYIMIFKWQIVNILIVLASSHYLMVKCVHFNFNENKQLVDVILRNECWMPSLYNFTNKLNGNQLHLIFAQSLNLAESGMLGMNYGGFIIDRINVGVGIFLFTIGLTFWFISCQSLALLVLNFRGDTIFQNSVYQLKTFLKSERVENTIIDRVTEHFRYFWHRTKGINIQQLTNERIGAVFRQDLSYYFYKKTFTILDTIIGGGEIIQRQLASVSDKAYYLPKYEIFREMDICRNICIVHRGRVNIYKDGKQIIILTKMRDKISKSRQAKNNFMATKNIFVEKPYDSVPYLLRGRKTIILPRHDVPLEATGGTWYSRWLCLAWLIGPFCSSFAVLIFVLLPPDSDLWFRLYALLSVTDLIDLINLIAEFYSAELIVAKKKLAYRRFGAKKFKHWTLYLDGLSLLLPLFTILTNDWRYQLARLLRLKFFLDFDIHFCRGFSNQKAPYVLKFAIILLLLHLFTTGWILIGCQQAELPTDIVRARQLNITMDFTQWVPLDARKNGCARVTRTFIDSDGKINPSFVVPKYWLHDYVVALTYILLIHTHTSIDTVIALSLNQLYYKIFVTFIMYLLDIWIMALAFNYAFKHFRVLYNYDYSVQKMLMYLAQNGINQAILDIVKKYTDQLWAREKGDWLPELAYDAPPCLRNDLFSSLYMHHLESAPTFRQLPDYFKRQLCSRFSRLVVFPGKCIVREGDTFSTTYFIHQGEVEKWFTDASGEGQLTSILYTNGYFGCISGVIRSASFRFSYYSRTVVDLVYLDLSNWEDLIESYPEIKRMLFTSTKPEKKHDQKPWSEGYDEPQSQRSRSTDKIVITSKIPESKTETLEESKIEWSNLIFLPFHPVFQLFVLCSVFLKVVLGPIQSVYPIVYCSDVMDRTPVLLFIKYCYWYFCDAIYGIDTFLHIVHRQVTDQAMRREHLPKSAGLLIVDIISLIPFLHLVMPNPCPVPRLWPNILAFNEFLIIYRVTEYFSLLNETDVGYTTYVYAYTFVFSFTQKIFLDNETKPSAILEFVIVCMFLICAYILNHFIVIPKLFAESLLRLRRVCNKYPVSRKIIAETKRRNPTTNADKEVENVYKIIWRKRSGVVHIPMVFTTEIPKYLRLEIKQDLLWPLYFHSPILRKTSFPLQRYLSEYVQLSYRMPGERFFIGDHSASSLYYIKSGIVQLISADDGITPIFSVTSGTIFGDINFSVPNYNRKVACLCLTYCEVYVVQRKYLIQALHKYPIDREIVMDAIRDRLNHAKKLFNSKMVIRGLDRNEDEGIAWINRRWWEIYEVFEKVMEHTGFSREQIRCDLPREESIYHCAKYLGQLVLCTPTELQTKSMFTNVSFPWIINPVSKFGFVWHRIVFVTVMMVLCVFPPNLVKREIPSWFTFFTLYTDTIYGIDIAISLFTAVRTEDSVTTTFTTVLFERFKSFTFMLDILSSIWIEDLAFIVGAPQYYYTFQFNRLIKIYVLFYGIYLKWDIRRNPLVDICRQLILINFTYVVLTSHIVFELTNYIPQLTKFCVPEPLTVDCVEMNPVTGVAINWAFEWAFCEYVAMNLSDTYVGIVITFISSLIFLYCRSTFVSYMYLESRVMSSYQSFVSNLKKYYEHYSIHVDLLRRLDRYFICHWKYYQGHDVILPNSMIEEPIEVYWKAQGEVAQRIISKSITFTHADPSLIRELACMARFLVLPKNAIIFMFGTQVKNVTWIVQGFVKVESHDENGEIVETYYGPGSLLSIAATIYIPINKFYDIYKKYSLEYEYLQNCVKEFTPMVDEMFKNYLLHRRDYQQKLRERIHVTRLSMISTAKLIPELQENRSLPLEGDFQGDPESKFMQTWLMFRTIVLAYHDDRGIMITDTKKCLLNYVTKAFILDLIGVVPVYEVLKAVLAADIDDDTSFLINTVCKFAHIYILFAYFQYISDLPTVNRTLINIVKWQLVNSLLVLGASHYFMVVCVKYEFNERNMELLSVTLRDTCWMPDVMTMPFNLSWDDLHLIFAESLSLAENGMMGLHFGRFLVDNRNFGVGFCLLVIGFIFWFISCHALTLLVLDARGDFLFQHSVNQLDRFLTSERVEKPIIQKAMQHFRYCWVRTKGIGMAQLTNESIGVVFRQDLNYFFYKKTFGILDTIIKGGEAMQRQLASVSTQAFFLEGHDIFRENDLSTYLCVIHRGKVVLKKKDRKLIVLTKVRRTIMRNPQHKSDFLATKNVTLENPYDTVKYLLRGRKTIKLPWNDYPMDVSHGSWYSHFLHLTWFVGPFITTVCVNSFVVLPTGHNLWYRVYLILFICDVIHLANFIADFYSIELVVVQNKCVHQRVGRKKLRDWALYVDILSFLIPLGTIINNDWRYQFARMLRLKYFFNFEYHFCRGFKRRLAPILLKIAILILVIHCFTCGWVYVACRRNGKFPIPIRDMRDMAKTIDFSQWTHPDDRGEGCARATRDIRDEEDPAVSIPTFVVPKYWPNDYIVALTYILLIHTHTNVDTIMPLSINEVYYKVITTFILQLLDIYIMALAINAAYTKYRELYQYNFSIKSMLIYLTDSGLSRSLSDNVWAYTVQLWKRQKGDKLPNLAYQGPPCLRQDLFTALYIHHLEAPPTFRMLPDYFKRQLAARLQRTVVFPGKCIVREGDTFNITYFIHEGEVEKWYIDKSGENKLMSVLYTNGYFGCMPGLFVNVGFHFSYYSRTVVDLVYLDLDQWKDLLASYPDIKAKLYESTRNMKKDHTKRK
ncbi:hypothetical protein HW555_006943 [Spodoptera exigua]|uniref:Cyclic nucleotide-binding domain-containing protein n=1 Tax=Spodoptera exigua TaxID=7107 RepID=A0A835L9G6_SPOEX|nr:hypothetical protein HW555_006943 [Spodoptera exigua]